MPLKLTPVSKDNWLVCSRLDLPEHQRDYVASNLDTIAESKFEPHYQLRAIEKDGAIIGMLAFCPEADEPIEGLYWLFRLMLAKEHQGKGYGKLAVSLSLKEMQAMGATKIRTMCKPQNSVAESCYLSLGFQRIGLHDDGDLLFDYSFSATAS